MLLLLLLQLFQIVATGAQVGELSIQQPIVYDSARDTQQPRVAIIGAGASGSSAAYHLQKFTSHGYNITIYEKNDYIGGRSTTIGNYRGDNSDLDVELGGSIFVDVNKILLSAAKEFNLSLMELGSLNERYDVEFFDDSVGIWNGTGFVFTTSKSEYKWWSLVKVLWKYGVFSPWRVYRLVKSVVGEFCDDYYHKNFPFRSFNEINEKNGFNKLLNATGEELLLHRKISYEFIHEIIESVTRLNYRSNIDDIHGLETLVSLAADGKAYRIKGGNYKIFEKWLEFSKGVLKLSASVNKINLMEDGLWNITSVAKNGEIGHQVFDQVILASPFHQSGIIFDSSIKEPVTVDYRNLYVTFIETNRNHPINHPVFNRTSPIDRIPEQILTIRPPGSKLPFFSVGIVDYNSTSDQIIYKVFSSSPVDNAFLSSYLFDDQRTSFKDVKIIFSKKWKAYPHLKPTIDFADFAIGANFWYLNTIESFISTMETTALSGANVAGLISIGRNTTAIEI